MADQHPPGQPPSDEQLSPIERALEPETPETTPAPAPGRPQSERDPAQESLQKALRGGFGLLSVIMVGLVVAYFANSIFIVEADETGLVARFGALRVNSQTEDRAFPPGTYVTLPSPFDQKIEIDSSKQSVMVDTFVFQRAEEDQNKRLSPEQMGGRELIPGLDGALMTGDKNLSHGLFEIQYVIDDAVAFVQNIGDEPASFDPILRRLASTVIMRAVASRTVDDILAEGQTRLALEIQELLQQRLTALNTGVRIEQILPQIVEPGSVRDAFNRVVQAQQQRETLINEAEADAQETLATVAGSERQAEVVLDLINQIGDVQRLADQVGEAETEQALADLKATLDQILDRTGGQVAVLLQNAQSEKNATRENIKQELERFRYRLAQYEQNPGVTALRLWIPVVQTVLGSADNEILFVPPDAEEIEIIVKRDEQRQLERERERAQQRPGR